MPGTQPGPGQHRLAVFVAAAGSLAILLIAAAATAEFGRVGLRMVRNPAGAAGWLGLPALVLGVGCVVAVVIGFHRAARAGIPPRYLAAAGLVLAAAVRLVVVLLVDAPVPPDGIAYRDLALRIASGECCFGERANGFPLMLAPLYAVAQPTNWHHEALNLVFGVAGAFFAFDIVLRRWGSRAAAVAIALYATAPSLVLLTPVLLVDTVYVTLMLGAVWALLRGLEATWLPWVVGSGLLLAAAQYVRPIGPALLPALAAVPLLTVAPRRGMLTILALLVAFGVGMSPVIVHNLREHGDLSVSTSSFGGAVLYIGTNQESDGRITSELALAVRSFPGSTQWERSKVAQDLAIRRMIADPASFAALAVRKFPIMWASEEHGVRYALGRAALANPPGATLLLLSQVFYVVVVVAACAGLWLGRRRSPEVLGVAVLVLATVGLHLAFEVKPRYHAWLIPFLIIVAATPIEGLIGFRTGRPAGSAPGSS